MTMDLSGKKVSVIGAGKSGIAAAELLQSAGADVLLSDFGRIDESAVLRLGNNKISVEEEGHSERVYDADLCVISPGIPPSAQVVKTMESKGIHIVSEIEIASRFCKARVVGITGTDGKTTTSTLIHRILEADGLRNGYRSFSVGNIGVPFSSLVKEMTSRDVAVVELSSYQLERCFTFRPDVAVITNITPLLSGTIAQQNLALDGSNATYQWASVNGVTDMSQPLASVTLTTQSNSVTSINATLSNLSINNSFYKAVGSTLPSSVTTNLTGQVYSLSGFVYSQYNSNASTPPTSYSVDPSKIPMPGTDFDYVVQGGPGSDIFLSLNTYTVPPVAVTPTNPNANINLDVVAQTASKGTYSLVVNVPNNASNVVFTPNAAFSVSTNSSNGHLLTITGQYSPSNLSAAPILGTINVTLNNMLNKGGQFSIDSVSTPTNANGVGQPFYFGTAETNASGQYSINNLPLGQMSLYPFNNPKMAQATPLSVNDALAAMSIAAGLGVPQGLGKATGSAANLLPSDFVAADWNHDGTVTAADALGILSYYVSVNKNPSAMTYSYLPAQSNSLAISTESVSNVSTPAITPFMTNLNILSAVPLNTGGAQTLDLVGALSGNIVAF